MGKKVLVTGADGFIGSHLTETLIQKGYEVKAFTYYNSFNNWGIDFRGRCDQNPGSLQVSRRLQHIQSTFNICIHVGIR